jgi:hypothetical protein
LRQAAFYVEQPDAMLMAVSATLEDPPTIFPASLLASGFNNWPNSDPGTRRPFRGDDGKCSAASWRDCVAATRAMDHDV